MSLCGPTDTTEEGLFLYHLGDLSRHFKIGIVGEFRFKKLPDNECGILDHGYYKLNKKQKSGKWSV